MAGQKHMIARARKLRRESTFPERLLWGRLRGTRCAGLTFRRQQPIDQYVVDFFCPECRLVVELDGQSHEGQAAEDAARQACLEGQGLRVLRFTNDRVLADLDGVVGAIARACAPHPG